MRFIVAALLVACMCIVPPVIASSGGHSHTATVSTHSGSHSKAAPWVHRDPHGKIARDPRQTNAFKKQHPCPSTGKTHGSCPGYVVDHVQPPKRGGADAPSNMQWQTTVLTGI